MSDKPAESASQETIWDLEIDPITGLTTNAEFLNGITVDDSLGRMTGAPGTVVQVFEVDWAVHKADFCVYFLENGSEYTASDGKTWRGCVLVVCPASFFSIIY